MHSANTAMAAGVMLAELDSLVRPLPGLLDGLGKADCNRLRAIGTGKAAGSLVNWCGARAMNRPAST